MKYIRKNNNIMKMFGQANGMNKNKGFTLVETLVAVAILVIATLGPLAIASQGITSAAYAKDQITAFYLAQEGIEYVRYVRDSNASIPFSSWLDTLSSCEVPTEATLGGCEIDAVAILGGQAPIACSPLNNNSACTFLNKNSEYFVYTSGTPTTYKRLIKIIGTGNVQRQVKVIVTWSSRGLQRSFTLNETIYNSYK
jgi:prepilin-type N-terminal cleavage/methylation domain-containing protein